MILQSIKVYSFFLAAFTIAFAVRAQTVPTTSATTVSTTQPTRTAFPVSGHGDLMLTLPDGWQATTEPPTPNQPTTVRLNDVKNRSQMLLSILPAPAQAPADFNSPARLHAIADAQSKGMLATSKEKSATLDTIDGKSARGFFYSLSDRTAPSGSFEHVCGAVVGVGDLILSSTILTHEKESPEKTLGISMLAGASQEAGATAGQTISASIAGKNWQLAFGGAGFKIVQDQTSPDGHARSLTAIDERRAITVSIFLEPAAAVGDAKVARAYYFDRLKHSPLILREDHASDFNEAAREEYLMPDLDQRHINLYFAREAIWVDVHLSADGSNDDAKRDALELIAKSVRIEPKS